MIRVVYVAIRGKIILRDHIALLQTHVTVLPENTILLCKHSAEITGRCAYCMSSPVHGQIANRFSRSHQVVQSTEREDIFFGSVLKNAQRRRQCLKQLL